jgi:hypothetical protein
MLRIFDFLLLLYPAEFRVEFGEEMRAVFASVREPAAPSLLVREYCGLLRGAVVERCRLAYRRVPFLAGGAIFALGAQFLIYWCLLPGAAHGQTVKEDAAAVELARSIYSASFTALRDAKTLDDLRKVSDEIDAAEWISVDRFGRTILTKKDADRDLESLLSLPPARRAAGMENIGAERDAERLIVVAWMMPNRAERADPDGEFGEKGATHQLNRGTLIRDIFVKKEEGWRRIRHDKITPNDLVLAVDGASRIVPPLADSRRVTPQGLPK